MSLAIVPRVRGSLPARSCPSKRPSQTDDVFLRRVRCQFAWLEHHVPTLNEVARSLAVSERTLRRHLRSLDTSYSGILRQVRQELSQQALIYSDLTIDQIAASLGYSEATNFRHAFRRWVGCSPQVFRAQARSFGPKELIEAAA